MKTKLKLAAIFLLPFSTCLSSFAQGSLTPPGAPAPTMKSLDQLEARTAILNTSSLVKISQPGSYYLTANLTVSTGNGIDINTNSVTVDLNGFTIRSTAATATGTGISLNSGLKNINISIVNGFIQGGVTNNGSGVYNGGGFAYGIFFDSPDGPVNVLASRVSVSGCLVYGIYLGVGYSTVMEACTVRSVGSYGLFASTVQNCSAVDCGYLGIYGDQVSDCCGESSVSGFGTGIQATTAQNRYGTSNGSGYRLFASAAQNCQGATSSGYGLYVSTTASGCSGSSDSGVGLYAFIANVCHGQTLTGTALSTFHNVNSF